MSRPQQTPTDPVTFQAARARYKRGWVLLCTLAPLLSLPLWVAAWLEPEPPGGWPFLLLVVAAPALSLFALIRLGGASLEVTPDGQLIRRSAVRQSIDLRRLTSVAITPSVPYPDQKRYEQFEGGRQAGHVKYAYDLRDAAGNRVEVAPRYQWQHTQGVLAQVVKAIHATQARCEPRCWELLHEDAALQTPPLPEWLRDPETASWGTPLPIRVANESKALTPTRGAVLAGGVPQAVFGFLNAAALNLAQALVAVATGAATVAIGFAFVRRILLRAREDQVRIDVDGHLRAVSRRAWSASRLGYKLVQGSVDLRNLRRVELTPGTRTDGEGRPSWWNLELDDLLGGQARIDLFHPREPAATLLPQLAHHLEATGIELDRRTHDGLSMRLGRPLTNPKAG